METRKRTPLELFNMPQRFVIPLFQRPYVWEEEDQWTPLWKDIQRTAEARLTSPGSQHTHFLGAVVLQSAEASSGEVTIWNVIDGQQRLTTLQLLADATQAVLAEAGLARLASKLEALTHNPEAYTEEGESRLKLRHLNRDRAAFDEVMDAEPGFSYDDLAGRDSRLAQAHRFFSGAVSGWLRADDSGGIAQAGTEPGGTGDAELTSPESVSSEPISADTNAASPVSAAFTARAETLTSVLQSGLQMVSIDLTASEDSQEIFETLNARGTPLTAADLIRNFVFQRLEIEGADSARAYEKSWPFEAKFWEKEIRSGSQFVARSSLFLNQWLTARTGEEITRQSTFSAFKRFFEQAGRPMSQLLPELQVQADRYRAWTEASERSDGDLDPVDMAFYRMRAAGIELLKPLILALTDPARALPDAVVNRVINAAESWVYRRQMLRLSTSDLGRVVAEIIRGSAEVEAERLSDWVTGYLGRLNVAGTYWPGDAEVRTALLNEPTYRRYPRPRLRMLLEAVEDSFRSETRQPQVMRGKLPIEHILPQTWQESWPVASAEAADERTQHVHRLGNLTLLTKSLNSKVSNGAWREKRQALMSHNTMVMTGRLLLETDGAADAGTWDERRIDERSAALADTLLAVWPVPEGHEGQVVDPQAKVGTWVELRHLVDAGLLAPGTELIQMRRGAQSTTALVTESGQLVVEGKRYDTPSAAAGAVVSGRNGWIFWGLPDGRLLRDLRTEFLRGAQR